MRSALAEARRRLPTILAWSAFASTIALIMQVIDRRVPIISLVLSISWSCLSYLMLPVMVFEGVGVREGVRRTKALFRATWQQEVVGTLRLGVVGVVLMIPAFILVVFGLAIGSGPAILLAAAVAALWIGLCILVLSCLGNVFRVALYQYAATGTTPPQFAGLDLSRALRTRRARGPRF